MKIAPKDWLFIGIALALISLLVIGNMKKLGPDAPASAIHNLFYTQLNQGEKRQQLEKGCVVCHPPLIRSKNHPQKEECMVCHQLAEK